MSTVVSLTRLINGIQVIAALWISPIDRDGRWFHEGSEIKRVELVSLFAGLLRRENDGAYYLVTPVEKVEV